MLRKGALIRILAIVGTVLVWFPIVAPILLSVAFLVRVGRFGLDYLMPAELFPIVLVGAALLIWAAVRARSRRKLIIWGLAIAVALLVGSQALAVVTGLASGATEPAGVWWVLVVAGIIGLDLAVIALGVGGILLLRDLRRVH